MRTWIVSYVFKYYFVKKHNKYYRTYRWHVKFEIQFYTKCIGAQFRWYCRCWDLALENVRLPHGMFLPGYCANQSLPCTAAAIIYRFYETKSNDYVVRRFVIIILLESSSSLAHGDIANRGRSTFRKLYTVNRFANVCDIHVFSEKIR